MKKNLTKSLALCVLFLAFFGLKAQRADLLKSFINKNDIAVRSVQKYSINLNDQASADNVKELLILQSASVKLFNSNPSKSSDLAYIVREKSSDFLSKNSKGDLEYLKLSDKEKAFFSSPKQVEKPNSILNRKELDKINSANTKDPHLFDGMNTRIK
jgi:hypothetical protein